MSHENENRSIAALTHSEHAGGADLKDEAVAGYLRLHPEFFDRHPDLLQGLVRTMTPPSRFSGDGVVDMQRYMVESLRGEIAGLRDCANEVIETSRANLAIQTRTHAAVLTLVAAPDISMLMRTVTDDLPILLDVDVVTLSLEPGPGVQPMIDGIGRLRMGDVDRFVGIGRDVALYREMADDGSVFGSGAGLVRSAALARIRSGEDLPMGLLAFGCRSDGGFHPGQGTELLRFLASIVEVCLIRLLPVPA